MRATPYNPTYFKELDYSCHKKDQSSFIDCSGVKPVYSKWEFGPLTSMKLCWLIPDGDLAWYNPVQKSWEISNTHTESLPLLRAWVVIKNLHLLRWETLLGSGWAIAITDFRDQGVASEGTFFKRCLMRGGRCQSSTLSSANVWECDPGCKSQFWQNPGVVAVSMVGKEMSQSCCFSLKGFLWFCIRSLVWKIRTKSTDLRGICPGICLKKQFWRVSTVSFSKGKAFVPTPNAIVNK